MCTETALHVCTDGYQRITDHVTITTFNVGYLGTGKERNKIGKIQKSAERTLTSFLKREFECYSIHVVIRFLSFHSGNKHQFTPLLIISFMQHLAM